MKKIVLISCLAISLILISNPVKSQLADGTTAPNFTLVDINGTSHSLYTYLNAGKTVLIDFSATWCPYCWAYHTSGAFQDFYTQHGPGGDNTAMVLFIEADQSSLACIQGTGSSCGTAHAPTQGNWTLNTTYPILMNGASVATTYSVPHFPYEYMICAGDRKTRRVEQYSIANLNAVLAYCPAPLLALDAGISTVASPNGTICSTTISPSVSIHNYGSTTITSCTIKYKIDASTLQTYNWSGSLASELTANVTLPNITTTAGSHTFTIYTSNPNGGTDGNAANDQIISNFTVNSVGASLPVAEGFESSANIPTGWSLYNPDGDAAWEISTTFAHTGTHSIGFNNCNGDGSTTDMTGRIDKFTTAAYNLSNVSSSNMTFDVAYACFNDGSTTYGDTLIVYSSYNCGSTWTQIYKKAGATLASAPVWTSNGCWSPTSTQWRTDNISLNSLVGQSNVMFRFENHSGWGGWVYLDNISITGLVGVPSYATNERFVIYPNPATSSFTIEGTSIAEKVHYSVYNIVGEEIKSAYINGNGSNFQSKVQTVDMPSGIYFLKVTDGNNSLIQKLIIQ